MKRNRLSAREVDTALELLNRSSAQPWQLLKDKLHKTFLFEDFAQAFGFMTEVALIAEKMNHHPEWLNVYKEVHVDLTTHHADGITELDFRLANAMERISATRRPVRRTSTSDTGARK